MEAYCELQISLSNDDFTAILSHAELPHWRDPDPLYLLNSPPYFKWSNWVEIITDGPN